ncbi:hypothetical protein BGX24_002657 [Mortierella sp. AD032]|nr:hypothetical protein BGX24_002657 [Mortierella sp. AD032]
MDTVQEQFQAMAIDAVEDNQDQDEDEEMMYASVDEFGYETTRQSVPSPTLTKISQCNAQSERKGLRTGQAPQDLLKLISFYLTEPLDLLRFSYTCHELYFFTATKDWYCLITYTYLFPLSCICYLLRNLSSVILTTSPASPRSQWYQQSDSTTRLPSSLDEFKHMHPLKVMLSEAQVFETVLET